MDSSVQSQHYQDFLEGTKQSLIMMVDDEPIISDITEAHLRSEGYQSFLAVNDSRLALEVLAENRVDLLLLDLNMPHVNGFEILEAVRADARYRMLPVIVMTSAADPSTKIRALKQGATDFLAKPVDPAELFLRVRNCLVMKVYERQLLYFDSATYLPNRRYFTEESQRLLAEHKGSEYVLFTVVLDQLKRITEAMGADLANSVVQLVSKSLSSVVHKAESSASSYGARWIMLARIGPDEFACLLAGSIDRHQVQLLADQIKKSVGHNYLVGDHELYVSASVGVAVYPHHGADSDKLIRASAAACAQAKKEGGDTCRIYSEQYGRLAKQQLSLDIALRRALEKHEFYLVYQPKIDLRSERVTGAEALLRWRTADGEIISPDHFIPLAEETGLIVPIGQWVMETAFSQLRLWEAQGLKNLNMAINVAAAQFFDTRFIHNIERTAKATNTRLQNITLEMTEGTLIGEDGLLNENLQRLKAMGIRVSIDDFGTGYSSLSYLKRFPLDELKIDRSFVRDLPHSEGDLAIVGAVMAMARSLNFKVVAEGVEEYAQLQLLRSYGCDVTQGFFFSEPLLGNDFVAFIKAFNYRRRIGASQQMYSGQ